MWRPEGQTFKANNIHRSGQEKGQRSNMSPEIKPDLDMIFIIFAILIIAEMWYLYF